MRILQWIIAVLLVTGTALALKGPGGQHVLGGYATSLQGRTRGQRINALLAARRLDNVTLEPGETFSFNRRVGPWSPDRGYVIAPVSYDGELVADWGGGVCQTSTTLYNAALLAGLEVIERHRHTWAPKYVPPGRDAAVAQHDLDLRFRNPYPWPIRIRARVSEESVAFEVLGAEQGPMASVQGDPRGTVEPIEIVKTDERLGPGQRRIVTRGRPGVRVSVYRRILKGPKAGDRELISHDTYPPMNRLIRVGGR
jgi:vancomycin resistance protein VanW